MQRLDPDNKALPTTARHTLNHDLRVLRRVGWVIVGAGVFALGFILHQLFRTTWLAEANQDELTEAAQTRFASITVERVPSTSPALPLGPEPNTSPVQDPQITVDGSTLPAGYQLTYTPDGDGDLTDTLVLGAGQTISNENFGFVVADALPMTGSDIDRLLGVAIALPVLGMGFAYVGAPAWAETEGAGT